jgi:hypothetical protein
VLCVGEMYVWGTYVLVSAMMRLHVLRIIFNAQSAMCRRCTLSPPPPDFVRGFRFKGERSDARSGEPTHHELKQLFVEKSYLYVMCAQCQTRDVAVESLADENGQRQHQYVRFFLTVDNPTTALVAHDVTLSHTHTTSTQAESSSPEKSQVRGIAARRNLVQQQQQQQQQHTTWACRP